MPNDQFYNIVGAMFNKCLEVLAQKGHIYAGDDNRLANFERAAARRGVPPNVIIDIYRHKHEDAIDTFRRELDLGEASSDPEPPEMRYVDDINYLLLDFADAVANGGYEPQEEWLRNALAATDQPEHPNILQLRKQFAEQGLSVDPPPDATPTGVTVAHVPKGKDGDEAVDVCCNPDGDDCCDTEPTVD